MPLVWPILVSHSSLAKMSYLCDLSEISCSLKRTVLKKLSYQKLVLKSPKKEDFGPLGQMKFDNKYLLNQIKSTWFQVSMTMMLLLQTSGLLVLVYYAVSIFQVGCPSSGSTKVCLILQNDLFQSGKNLDFTLLLLESLVSQTFSVWVAPTNKTEVINVTSFSNISYCINWIVDLKHVSEL